MWESLVGIISSDAFVNGVITVLGIIIARYAVPWLNGLSEKAKAEIENKELETREHLVYMAKNFIYENAQNIVEREFPTIAEKILRGELKDKNDIKLELYRLGSILKTETITVFAKQNINIVAEVGNEFLDYLIETAANQVSPFPGKETAVEFLKKGVAKSIITKGVNYVRETVGQED